MIEMRGHGKKMMQDKAVRWLGAATFCLVSGAFAACAGSKTPNVSDELEAAIEDTYGNGSVGVAGSGNGGNPSGGRGGSANAGAAGGSSLAGNGGAASSGACDGFGILQEHCGGNNCHGA